MLELKKVINNSKKVVKIESKKEEPKKEKPVRKVSFEEKLNNSNGVIVNIPILGNFKGKLSHFNDLERNTCVRKINISIPQIKEMLSECPGGVKPGSWKNMNSREKFDIHISRFTENAGPAFAEFID